MIELTDEQWGRLLALIPKLHQSRASAIIAGAYLTDEEYTELVELLNEKTP